MTQRTQDDLGEFLEDLQKMAPGSEGAVRLALAAQDFDRATAFLADERTEEHGLLMLKAWEDGGEPLRKAMAAQFLDRAHALFKPAASAVASAAGSARSAGRSAGGAWGALRDRYSKGMKTFTDKVGDLGARAGEEYAQSGLKGARAARDKAWTEGRTKGEAAMRDRLSPKPKNLGPRLLDEGAVFTPSVSGPRFLDGAARGPSGSDLTRKAIHEKAIIEAGGIGGRSAVQSHVAGYASRGREIGRTAAQAAPGVAAVGAGLGAAAAGGSYLGSLKGDGQKHKGKGPGGGQFTS